MKKVKFITDISEATQPSTLYYNTTDYTAHISAQTRPQLEFNLHPRVYSGKGAYDISLASGLTKNEKVTGAVSYVVEEIMPITTGITDAYYITGDTLAVSNNKYGGILRVIAKVGKDFSASSIIDLRKYVPGKSVACSVLYGKIDTVSDEDKMIVEYDSSAVTTTNSATKAKIHDLMDQGWTPLAMYGGQVNGEDIWIAFAQIQSANTSQSELTISSTTAMMYSGTAWGEYASKYVSVTTQLMDAAREEGVQCGYELNHACCDMMENYANMNDENRTRLDTMDSTNMFYIAEAHNSDGLKYGSNSGYNVYGYYPMIWAVSRKKTPDGTQGKFYVPTTKELCGYITNVFSKSETKDNFHHFCNLIGLNNVYVDISQNYVPTCLPISASTTVDGVKYISTATSYCKIFDYTRGNSGTAPSPIIFYHYGDDKPSSPFYKSSLTLTNVKEPAGQCTSAFCHYAYTYQATKDSEEKVVEHDIFLPISQNTSLTDKVERTVSLKLFDCSATTTFMQDVSGDTYSSSIMYVPSASTKVYEYLIDGGYSGYRKEDLTDYKLAIKLKTEKNTTNTSWEDATIKFIPFSTPIICQYYTYNSTGKKVEYNLSAQTDGSYIVNNIPLTNYYLNSFTIYEDFNVPGGRFNKPYGILKIWQGSSTTEPSSE